MDYKIERTPEGRGQITLLEGEARTVIAASPSELFRLASDIMDACYRWDEEAGGVPDYTLCDTCASVIEEGIGLVIGLVDHGPE